MIKKIIFIMRGFLILFMIFIFSSSFVYAGSAPGTELDFADEWKGTFSGYTKKAYLVIEDETEWQEVWDKAFPNESIPDIDFDDYIVIAVFMGEKTYSGYKANISDVYDKNYSSNSPFVDIAESYNRYGSSREIQPYHIVALQKNDFPEDTDFNDTEFDIRTVVNTNNSTSSSTLFLPRVFFLITLQLLAK